MESKSYSSYTITGVNIWNGDQIADKFDLVVSDGVITRMAPTGSIVQKTEHKLAADNLVLMPRGVDPQVHLRVPGQSEKETAATGLRSALYGGIGAVLTMPNTSPVIDSPDVVKRTREELEAHEANSSVKSYLSAAISKGQKGKEPVDFAALAKAQVKAFTDDGYGVESADIMRAAFKASSETGIPILQHAEHCGHGGVIAASSLQEKLGTKAYPETAETEMVARDLKLLADYPHARYHVLHISSAKTVDLVTEAKEKGLQASCEVSPHHLYFCSEDIDESNSSFKMNPPLRALADKNLLQEALADGRIDFVATDHAPHEESAKQKLLTAAYGTIGLETSLKTLVTLYQRGALSAERLVQVFANAPANFLEIETEFGLIEEGRPMEGVLVDIDYKASVKESDFHGLTNNSCFIGSELYGKIEKVLSRELIYPPLGI